MELVTRPEAGEREAYSDQHRNVEEQDDDEDEDEDEEPVQSTFAKRRMVTNFKRAPKKSVQEEQDEEEPDEEEPPAKQDEPASNRLDEAMSAATVFAGDIAQRVAPILRRCFRSAVKVAERAGVVEDRIARLQSSFLRAGGPRTLRPVRRLRPRLRSFRRQSFLFRLCAVYG